MGRTVQKYGGSSVATAQHIVRIAERIAGRVSAGDEVVAVVSAMGDRTDDLYSLAAEVSSSPSQREMDVLLSTGETVTSTLLSMALHEAGLDAVSLSGAQAGIRTDTIYGRARISEIATERIERELSGGRVVIVAGFQGVSDDYDVTTLGRGGSDTTAVALAAALGAKRCEIYTDVAGVYTADPRICPRARPLRDVGYDEMLELATTGARVHHAGARGRQFQHLVVANVAQRTRPRADARIGRVDPRDVRVDLAPLRPQRGGQRHRGRVAAAATERRHIVVVRDALEPGDDDDLPGGELAVDAGGLDAGDAGAAVDGVRLDAGLRAGEADGVHPEVVQRHREQRGRDDLAGRKQHVKLTLAGRVRDPGRERDQVVRRVAHRRHDGDDVVVAGSLGDAPRDVAHALGVRDGAATVLLHDAVA